MRAFMQMTKLYEMLRQLCKAKKGDVDQFWMKPGLIYIIEPEKLEIRYEIMSCRQCVV